MSNNPVQVSQTNGSSVTKHAKVSQVLENYVAFDFEWDTDTHVMEAASFVDSFSNSKVYLRSDFGNSSEIELLERINAELLEYDWSIGWKSTGNSNDIKKRNVKENGELDVNDFGSDDLEGNNSNYVMSDLGILYERCNANGIDCIVFKHSKDRYELPGLNHIDLCQVYCKVMVQDTIYKIAYKTHKLDEVSKVLLGYGKYQGITGKDFLTLSPDEQRGYSVQDSKLVMELSKHNNFEVLDALYEISEITDLNLSVFAGPI
jgi:hypothetical protein